MADQPIRTRLSARENVALRDWSFAEAKQGDTVLADVLMELADHGVPSAQALAVYAGLRQALAAWHSGTGAHVKDDGHDCPTACSGSCLPGGVAQAVDFGRCVQGGQITRLLKAGGFEQSQKITENRRFVGMTRGFKCFQAGHYAVDVHLCLSEGERADGAPYVAVAKYLRGEGLDAEVAAHDDIRVVRVKRRFL